MNKTSDFIYRQAVTLRYALGFGDRLAESLAPLERAIVAAIREFEDAAISRDFDALLINDTRNRRVRLLFDTIDELFTEYQSKIVGDSQKELSDFVELDAAKKAEILETDKQPSPDTVLALPILGLTAYATINNLFPVWRERIRAAIVDAESNDADIIGTLRGSRENNYRDGAFHPFRESLRRSGETVVAGVAANTSTALYEAAGVEYEMIVATLDHRTCLTCAPLDGKVYQVGKGPHPPFHPRCRCVRVGDERKPGERPFVDDERSVKDIPKDERAGKIGQTTLKYKAWFESLSEESQRNVLGPARFELWKSGQFELNEFSAGDAGKILNLKELGEM